MLISRPLLASLLAVGLLAFAGCGDDDSGAGTTTATETTSATAGADTPSGQGRGGEGGDGSGRRSGTSGSDDQGPAGADDGGTSGGDDGPVAPAGGDFVLQLRQIVGASLTELSPLASGGAATGAPGRFASMLKTATGELDDTISELEALDPPSGAEAGTQQMIDAFSELRDAVSRGADDFGSGDQERISSALKYLTTAAADFRSALVDATETLSKAGISATGG